MPGRLYFGACSLLIRCLNVFMGTTAALKNTDVGIQSRQQTSDNIIQILREIHGKTYSLPLSSNRQPFLVGSEVSCFTIQLLYSAEGADHKVMLWLHYTEADTRFKRVHTISFAVKEGTDSSANNVHFEFEGSSKNGLTVKEAEFVQHTTCNGLKITLKDGRCVYIALPPSSGTSCVDVCAQTSERGRCTYETYDISKSEECLKYEVFKDTDQPETTEVPTPSPDENKPLLETDTQLQEYQDFKRGLLFSSLVLVYSSYGDDRFPLCMITYKPNETPGPHGNIYILTPGLSGDQAMVQAFEPYTLKDRNATFKSAARINRNGNRRQCILLRTPGYQNLCELFTGGRYTNGILNNICFFIYTVYCKQPAKKFTNLGDCWPPAKKGN
uniref:Putative secreted histamine binding protein of 21.3 kDa n=2 Tax=Ixodes ricinus TaxID=34613 RepID=V5GJ33_IXORI